MGPWGLRVTSEVVVARHHWGEGHGRGSASVSQARECWGTTVLGGGHHSCQGWRIGGGRGGRAGCS